MLTGKLRELEDISVDPLNDKRLLSLVQAIGFKPCKTNKHGNSLFLEAIAYNRTLTALILISLAAEYDADSLLMKDSFPSSCSSPLILAAKTGNNAIALLLLALIKSNLAALNAQDYLGNTPLHYACLMRNTILIYALLANGANTDIRNAFGASALDYYNTDIAPGALEYHYGPEPHAPEVLRHVCDWDESYQGTHHPFFSNYRWFLPHICANLNLVPSATFSYLFIFDDTYRYKRIFTLTEAKPAKDMIDYHLETRTPVVDGRLYGAMTHAFLTYHKGNYDSAVADKLRTSMTVPGDSVVILEDYFSC